MKNYQIDIWFDQVPEKIRLGTVTVLAQDETEALISAMNRTEHWIIQEQ